MNRTSLAILLIALAGGMLRAAAAWASYPWTGDPTFSYCYRAMLIYHGDASGVFLMWHYPGYPCLIAAVMVLSGGLLSAYAAGLLLSAGSSLALVFLVDRLVRPLVVLPATRLVIASFLAFYENLALYACGPLTEPVYLLLIYGALAVVYPPRLSFARAFAAGLLLGGSCTIRSEGLAPAAGLLAVVALSNGWGPGGSRWRAVGLATVMIAGLVLVSSWVLGNRDYMAYAYETQQTQFTVPPAHGLAANLARAVECAYYACTVWLPYTLLLPYWVLLSLGVFGDLQSTGKRRLTVLLLAVVVPSLAGVMLSIMHKRTGSFLLPAAAIWTGFGVEFLILRSSLGTRRWSAAVVVGAALLLNVGQAGRLAKSLRDAYQPYGPETYVQGRILRDAGAPAGKVWAFGGEPEVYQAWNQPIVYPLRQRAEGYAAPYRDSEGAPTQFVERLRQAGFTYLAFALKPDGDARSSPYEEQVYGNYIAQPRRTDLLDIVRAPSSCGLELVGQAPAGRGQTMVYVYRIVTG